MATSSVILLMFSTVLANAADMPPHIHTQSEDRDFYFWLGSLVPIRLPCVASGNPEPVYTWYRDGVVFDPSKQGGDVELDPGGGGTLKFKREPEAKDVGSYQCRASNKHGVSVSDKVVVKQARIGEFFDEPQRTVHADLGDSLTLPCVPPLSIPPARIDWVLNEGNVTRYAVAISKRVSMDLEGRLQFANVIKDDEKPGLSYVCRALNQFGGLDIVTGPGLTVSVGGTTENKHAPSELWTSPADQLVLKGDTLRLKCIFAGNPTPNVTWTKPGSVSPMPGRAVLKSHGQELEISYIYMSDAGEYLCEGSSKEYTTRFNKAFNIRVQASPYWIEQPDAVNKSIGDIATFTCKAGGIPEPTFSWFVNGVSLAETTDPRIHESSRVQAPDPNTLTISNLTLADSMVIQCNATNKHGYLWSDVPLGIEEPDCNEVDNVAPCKCTSDSCETAGSNAVTYSIAAIASLALVPTLITRM